MDHLNQNPPTLSSTMKTIFPNKNRRDDQTNLKIMIDYVELDIKAILFDEINGENCNLSSLEKVPNCGITFKTVLVIGLTVADN